MDPPQLQRVGQWNKLAEPAQEPCLPGPQATPCASCLEQNHRALEKGAGDPPANPRDPRQGQRIVLLHGCASDSPGKLSKKIDTQPQHRPTPSAIGERRWWGWC